MEIFHIITLGSLSLLILNYLLNLKVFRFPPIPELPASTPLISVLIPARNEEKRIRPHSLRYTVCSITHKIM